MFSVKFYDNPPTGEAGKEEWNNFILGNSNVFLQSFEWGNFQVENNKKVFRLQVLDDNKIILAQAQVFAEPFFIKKYFYIPYGPIFKRGLGTQQKKDILQAVVNELKKISARENCVFLRIEPNETLTEISGFRTLNPFKRLQPQKTLVLDLTKPEVELQAEFKQKNRQNINFAGKNNVIITNSKENFDSFCHLMKKTEERQDFGIHVDTYYRKLLNLNNSVKTELFTAKFEEKVINAIISLSFGHKAFSLHGGSDYNYRHYKSANLLYWEIIKAAKNRGLKEFDFWGIDEKKWPGVTTFKKSFGGKEVEFPLGADIVFNNFWYSVIKFVRGIKRAIK